MKCPNCDTYNPDNAKFCRTCGINLQDNDIFEKEEEKVHTPTVVSDSNYRKSTTNTKSNGGSSDWVSCCICLVVIFIVFALISILK